MKYRICKMRTGLSRDNFVYKIQVKKLFFWHNLGDSGNGSKLEMVVFDVGGNYYTRLFQSRNSAEIAAENFIFIHNQKWEILNDL